MPTTITRARSAPCPTVPLAAADATGTEVAASDIHALFAKEYFEQEMFNEAVIEFSITRARAAAWTAAQLLAVQSADLQGKTIAVLERSVEALARSIAEPGPLMAATVKLVALAESDDIEAIVERILSVRPEQ